MDYLYINAIVKEVYKDLRCGCPFSQEHSRAMYNTVSGLDCLSNPEIPDVLSFFTVRAKGQAPAIVFSRIQKHTNSASVGRFIQSIGWTWDGNLFQNLDNVLNVGFYSEQEINDTALQGGSFPLPKDRRSSYEPISIELPPQVKQAILTTVMLRWMRFDAPLRIAVPKNVDYNSYVLSAMKQIYSLFPVSLRTRAGFCSYMPNSKDLPETISIGFVPEEMADGRTLSLDGSSPAACNALNCGTDNTLLDAFIKYIATTSDEERAERFAEIYEDLEGSGNADSIAKVTYLQYQNYGVEPILKALDGDLNLLAGEWNQRFFKNLDKFSPRMQQRIRADIRGKINVDEFCKLAERRLSSEGFDGLVAYREYCIGNQALTDALWETALRLQVERNKSYTEIYNTVTKRSHELEFILDEAKLDSLFCLSIREQLHMLQASPAEDLVDVQKLLTGTRALLTYSESRPAGNALRGDVQTFYNRLQEQEQALILRGLTAALQHLQDKPLPNTSADMDKRTAEVAQFREKVVAQIAVPGTEQILTQVDSYSAMLQEHRNTLIYNSFYTRFTEIKERPSKTVEQIETAINDLKGLCEELNNAPQAQKFLELRQAISDLVAEKEAEIGSSHAKFMKIEQILNNPTLDYFQILEQLDKADKQQLEDHHHQRIDAKLAELRYRTVELYGDAFSRYYGKSLTLSNMAALPTYVFARISQDICQLKQLTFQCASNCKAVEAADRITGALAVAAKISDTHILDVNYNGNKLNPSWFRNLLRLKLDKSTVGDAQQMEEIFYKLVESGAFQGDEMVNAADMLGRCGLRVGKLFPVMLQGSFANATEEQYRHAFETMLQYSTKSKKETLEAMASKVQQTKDADRTAVRAFRDVERTLQEMPSRKPSKGIIALIAVLGVLVISLSIGLIVTMLNKGEAPTDPTAPSISAPTEGATEVAPTEPSVVYPEALLFYGNHSKAIPFLYGNNTVPAFADHSAWVETVINTTDVELSQAILDQYTRNNGTVVTIDENGTTIKWEEYFFWMLRYHADADASQLLALIQQETLDESALCVLRVIYQNLPQEEPQAEVEETVPAAPEAENMPTDPVSQDNSGIAEEPQEPESADIPGETEATDSTEEATEAIIAETEAPATEAPATEPVVITIADVKAAVIDAASGSYEASLPYADHLPLVWKLFGEDFTKDFSSHANLVAGLDMIGDAQSPAFSHFLKHYQIMPGDSVISFEEIGVNITWNEFVFWECWILASQGTTTVDAQTFDTDLYAQVAEVLTVVYQFVSEDEYPSNLHINETGSDIFQGEYEINSVLLNVIQAAKASFEREQTVYRTIWLASQGQ